LRTLTDGQHSLFFVKPYHTTPGGSPVLFSGFVKFLAVTDESRD
jgi:hypothetical protein